MLAAEDLGLNVTVEEVFRFGMYPHPPTHTHTHTHTLAHTHTTHTHTRYSNRWMSK